MYSKITVESIVSLLIPRNGFSERYTIDEITNTTNTDTMAPFRIPIAKPSVLLSEPNSLKEKI